MVKKSSNAGSEQSEQSELSNRTRIEPWTKYRPTPVPVDVLWPRRLDSFHTRQLSTATEVAEVTETFFQSTLWQ